MDKAIFIFMLIEAIIFLAPMIKMWLGIGAWKKEIEMKVEHNQKKVEEIKESVTLLSGTLSRINDTLIVISTKVDLLVAGKLKQIHDDDKK